MDEFYIPGFTNYLYSGEPDYGLGDYGMYDYGMPSFGAPPQYSEPAYYPEPSYYPEPVYSEPAYVPPAYSEPAYVPPAYSEPAYVPPAYSEPAYVPPVYTPPVEYSEPAYMPPVDYAPLANYAPPVEYSSPFSYAEQVGAPANVEPAYTPPTDYSSLVNYAPPVEYPTPATYAEQTGAPVAVEQDYPAPATYAEQTGAPVSAVPDTYAAPNIVSDGADMMLADDLAYSGPRPTKMPTPDVAIPYSKPSATPGLDFVTNDGQQGYYFVTNAGRAAKTKANPSAFVAADPNAQYRLVNERGQNVVVTSGSGEQGLRDAYAAAQRLSTEGGTKANWYLERSGPEGQWTRIADDDPKGSDLGVVGKVAGFALPIATALLTGGWSIPAQIAAATAAGAAGSALSGKDPLKGAAMGALTAVGGKVLGPALGKAVPALRGAAGAVGTGIGATAGGLATGQNLQNSLLGGLASGAAAYLTPQVAERLGVKLPGMGGTYDPSTEAITVRAPITTTLALSNQGGSAPKGDPGADNLEPRDIVVKANRVPFTPAMPAPPITLPTGMSPIDAGMIPPPDAGLLDQAEPGIDVIGTKTIYPEPDIVSPIPLALPGLQTLPTGPQPDLLKDVNPEAPPENNRLKDIVDYLRLAGLATSTLGGLMGGGGGGGSQFRMPSGTGALNSVFTSKLPPPNLPGGVGGGGTGARTAADLAGQGLRDPKDYYRYGYGPEQSFFSYVPQGEPNRSQAYTGYAEGGFAVEGAGDGRDDKIPALLSDGEYVIDAETVALLGNGSNKAGAKMLDKFRVNVRKQKGRKLARGKFSDNAKRPEHYMAGGHA